MKFACKVRHVRAILVSGVLAVLVPNLVEAADKPTKQQLIERGRQLFTGGDVRWQWSHLRDLPPGYQQLHDRPRLHRDAAQERPAIRG